MKRRLNNPVSGSRIDWSCSFSRNWRLASRKGDLARYGDSQPLSGRAQVWRFFFVASETQDEEYQGFLPGRPSECRGVCPLASRSGVGKQDHSHRRSNGVDRGAKPSMLRARIAAASHQDFPMMLPSPPGCVMPETYTRFLTWLRGRARGRFGQLQ